MLTRISLLLLFSSHFFFVVVYPFQHHRVVNKELKLYEEMNKTIGLKYMNAFKRVMMGERRGDYDQELGKLWVHAVQSLPANRTNSFLNTTLLNKKMNRSKKMLCIVFLKSEKEFIDILQQNVNATVGICDWAAIVFAGDVQLLQKSISADCLVIVEYKGPRSPQSDFVPKPVLYRLVPDIAKEYKRVWLLDSDMSFLKFDTQNYLNILDCALGGVHPPLVSQPLIEGSTQQAFRPLNSEFWKDTHTVVALNYYYAEIQAPLFDGHFLDWFVTSVVNPIANAFLILGADWGLGSIWCRMASMYYIQNYDTSKRDYNASLHTHSCLLVTGGTHLLHLDLKSMGEKYNVNSSIVNTNFTAHSKLMKYLIKDTFSDFFINSVNEASPQTNMHKVLKLHKAVHYDNQNYMKCIRDSQNSTGF